tara:strand:- start:5 stop:187 length:183 start_codon:yes stop_codon:yes gene_type:complete
MLNGVIIVLNVVGTRVVNSVHGESLPSGEDAHFIAIKKLYLTPYEVSLEWVPVCTAARLS